MSGSDAITIIGAGPVGCVLSLLLARKGLEVELIEKRILLPEASMAIGITPPSLRLLDQLGLGDRIRSAGVLIPAARVCEEQREVGTLPFRVSEDRICSLPQFGTLEILRKAVREESGIRYREGMEVDGSELESRSGWVIGCDGSKSTVREAAGIPVTRKMYPCRFVMVDAPDLEELGPEARITFSAEGAVESFPLPGGRRRWVAQRVNGAPGNVETVIHRVRDVTGIDLSDREVGDPWPFQPERTLALNFLHGQMVVCGDAAHTISPIGGQGMNLGFADAALLAACFPNPDPVRLRAYTLERKRAFRMASRRVASGMWLGTRTGPVPSALRERFLRVLLASGRGQKLLLNTFTMRGLPNGTVS